MSKSPDEPAVTPSAEHGGPDLVAETSPSDRPGFWRRFAELQFPAPAVVFLAVVMVPFGALMAYWAVPDLPWTAYLLQGIGSGWLAPLLIIVALSIGRLARPISDRIRDKRALRATALVISMVAARTRHYESLGTADPSKAAALDVAAVVKGQVPNGQVAEWVRDALVWRDTNAPDFIPRFPERLEAVHKRFSGTFSD